MNNTMQEDPTRSQYGAYGGAYDYFNGSLYAGRLPRCMLNFSRKSRRVLGYFAPDRWEHAGERTHEISLNPDLLYRPIEDVMGTLVHEMVHLWQQEFGTPSRGGYHNEEWANHMEAIGLIPSNTGKPGGRRTGQQMTHYILEGGPFQLAFRAMPRECLLPWQSGGVQVFASASKGKVTYLCRGCGLRVWGRAHLSVVCGCCQEFLLPYCSSAANA